MYQYNKLSMTLYIHVHIMLHTKNVNVCACIYVMAAMCIFVRGTHNALICTCIICAYTVYQYLKVKMAVCSSVISVGLVNVQEVVHFHLY